MKIAKKCSLVAGSPPPPPRPKNFTLVPELFHPEGSLEGFHETYKTVRDFERGIFILGFFKKRGIFAFWDFDFEKK